MEDDLRRRLAAAKSGKKVLDDNNTLWNAVTARAAKLVLLDGHITTIEDLDIIVTKDNKGHALNKVAKKNLAAEKAWKVAKVLAVFAKDTNDLVLHEEIDFEKSDLDNHVSDEDAPVRWKLVFDRASVTATQTAVTTDYGLTVGDISAINVARLSFLAAEPNSDAARAARTAAVAMQKNEFKAMALTIESIKELAVALNDTEAEFVKTLNTALKKDDIGGRIVDAVITYKDLDTGVLLQGVTCEVMNTGSKKKSTKNGTVQWKGLPNGNYKLRSVKKDYEENVLDGVAISGEDIKRIEIKLKRGPIEGTRGVTN